VTATGLMTGCHGRNVIATVTGPTRCSRRETLDCDLCDVCILFCHLCCNKN